MLKTKIIYYHDRSAPRMRTKEFTKQVVTRELFKKFLKEFPEHKDMKWEEFLQYWADITHKIKYEAAHNPLGVKLGSFTGELKVQYIPYNFELPNNEATQELGKPINHPALNSKGKIGTVKWERKKAVTRNKILQFYAFNESREIAKMAKARIENNPESIRVSSITLGPRNVWWRKISEYNKRMGIKKS